MHWKRKIPNSWRTGWKAKTCTSFPLHLKVFKNHLHYFWHVRVLSIKPCLHTQLPEHNRSFWKVSWGWGHLITWNGPLMGHLNSFSASGGGDLNKNFPKIQMPGGMFKLRFDRYITKACQIWGPQHLPGFQISMFCNCVFFGFLSCKMTSSVGNQAELCTWGSLPLSSWPFNFSSRRSLLAQQIQLKFTRTASRSADVFKFCQYTFII